MATTKKTTSTSFTTEVQNMINGLEDDAPSSLKSMNVGGSSMTLAQVIAQFQTILDMLTAVTAAKAAWQAAVAAKKTGLPASRVFYENVVANLKQLFGLGNQAQLAGFGIAAPKARTKPSSNTKAIAHAKALATREARGTMGSKQKKAITTTPQPTVQVLGSNGQPLGSTETAPASSASSAPAAATAAPVPPAAAPAPVAPAAVPAPTH